MVWGVLLTFSYCCCYVGVNPHLAIPTCATTCILRSCSCHPIPTITTSPHIITTNPCMPLEPPLGYSHVRYHKHPPFL